MVLLSIGSQHPYNNHPSPPKYIPSILPVNLLQLAGIPISIPIHLSPTLSLWWRHVEYSVYIIQSSENRPPTIMKIPLFCLVCFEYLCLARGWSWEIGGVINWLPPHSSLGRTSNDKIYKNIKGGKPQTIIKPLNYIQ